MDGTLWSIKYEFECYVLVAVLWARGLLKRGPILIILIVLVVSFGLQKSGVISPPQVDLSDFVWGSVTTYRRFLHGVVSVLISNPYNWPRLFSYFFAGAAFYLWRDVIPKSTALLVVSVVILAFGIRFTGAEVVMLTAGIYCLFFMTLSAGTSLRILNTKIDLSYGIYLFGFPIQQLIIGGTDRLPQICYCSFRFLLHA
jgi:peptidoglycan/LPS O-acetylase OafA/YrhL